MQYLYLDESGDLGFDFVTKKPSKFFTVTILELQGTENSRKMGKYIRKTISRFLPRGIHELKGSKTDSSVKVYMHELIKNIPFRIYSVTLNKKRVYRDLIVKKDRLYNFIAGFVLDKIKIRQDAVRYNLVVDKSKNRKEIYDFNNYIITQLKGKIPPTMPFDINHQLSHQTPGLQAVDMYSWGFFRKYEKNDLEWYNIFKGKVEFDDVYLKDK